MIKKKTGAILLLIIIMFTLTGCKSSDYQKAVTLFEEKKYEEAKSVFNSIPDYKDSASYLNEISYHEAVSLYEAKKYSEAKEKFTELGGLHDSQTMLKACDYGIANELYEAGEYKAAKEGFDALADYEDSKEKIKACDYKIADQLFENGDFDAAREAFTALSEYKDAPERVRACDYAVAEKLYESGQYDKAQTAFETLGEYEDSPERVKECIYSSGKKYLADNEFEKALSKFEQISGFKDSSALATACKHGITSNRYSEANALLQEEKYEQAASIFEELGSYEDSAKLNLYCKAHSLGNAGDFKEASSTFFLLGDFKDSNYQGLYYDACSDEADGKNDSWMYISAYEKFAGLKSFRDVSDHMQQCQEAIYNTAVQEKKDGNLEEAIEFFGVVIDYKDSASLLEDTKYELAVKCFEGVESDRDYDRAFQLFSELKDYNDHIPYYIGKSYNYGYGVEQDYIKAVEWYEKGAALGDAFCQNNLGCCYSAGTGVKQDYEKAKELFTKAAEQGVPNAQFNLAWIYCDLEQNYPEALIWAEKAAEQGLAQGQSLLAEIYADGLGTEKDYEKAVFWAEKAAEQGDDFAQNLLGDFCYNGQGTDQDYNQALKWYLLAAEQGNAEAQNSAANCYFSGEGTEQDYSKAFEWFSRSAEQGNADAQYMLARCYYDGYGVENEEDQAFKWFNKAAEQNNINSYFYVGECYYHGYGVPQDYNEAADWYLRAAEQGDPDAQFAIGYCYANGEGTELDYDKAGEWYEKAANQGIADAQNNLGVLYENGTSVQRDYEKAIYWYKKAAEQGNEIAEGNYERLTEILINESDPDRKETETDEAKSAFAGYEPGTYSAEAKGYGIVKVSITVDENSITEVVLDTSQEMPAIGGAATEELTSQIMAAQGPEIDGVSGASLTSNAVRAAVTEALEKAMASKLIPSGYKPGTYSAEAEGMGTVKVSITVDENSITKVVLDTSQETPEIGGAATEELASQIMAMQGSEIDGVTGASLTSNAVRVAVAEALEKAKTKETALTAVEGAEEKDEKSKSGGYMPGIYTAKAEGMGTVKVSITVDENSITKVVLDTSQETPAIGGAATEELTAQIMAAQGAEIDGVSGATITSGAVRAAVAEVLEKAKAKGAEQNGTITVYGESEGKCGPVKVKVVVDGKKIISIEIVAHDETPGIGTIAIESLPDIMVAKQTTEVDTVSGATLTSNAIKEAVLKALESGGIDASQFAA